MRKIILTLLAGFIALAGLTVTAGTADAAPRKGACVTLKEWKKIKEGNTQAQVKRIVGFSGRKDRTTHYGDGTISFSVDYVECWPGTTNRPGSWVWNTTTMYFSTEVKYGKWVWDDEKTWVDGEWVGANVWDSCMDISYYGNCIGGYYWDEYADYTDGHYEGGYTWDEYAENGHTRIPTVNYKGSF